MFFVDTFRLLFVGGFTLHSRMVLSNHPCRLYHNLLSLPYPLRSLSLSFFSLSFFSPFPGPKSMQSQTVLDTFIKLSTKGTHRGWIRLNGRTPCNVDTTQCRPTESSSSCLALFSRLVVCLAVQTDVIQLLFIHDC